MSLWLQSAIEAIEAKAYGSLREVLNHAPSGIQPIPASMLREIEYADRHFNKNSEDRLFPIRFMWLMELHEQRLFGYVPLARSRYHPEKLLDFWEKAYGDESFRNKMQRDGFRFDLDGKAVEMTLGWIYIGETFPDDLMDIERALGGELLFPDPDNRDDRRVAFQDRRKV